MDSKYKYKEIFEKMLDGNYEADENWSIPKEKELEDELENPEFWEFYGREVFEMWRSILEKETEINNPWEEKREER
jgi:hypothetical protein